MSIHPLAEYLLACRSRRNTGALTPETSLYGPLETLLNIAGVDLHPRVHIFMSLKNRAGTMPDGGLFTRDQIEDDAVAAPVGTVPKHGVIECKPPSDELLKIADSAQVSKYWNKYNQVLVTNYREFLLVGRDDAGNRVRYEHYRLVPSEAEFWTADAHELAALLGDEFLDFLRRCLLRPAPITDPESVAWFLASYAREARGRVSRASSVPALESVRKALEQALGIDFEDTAKPEEGRRFFRSTLVQTLFYGVFSAWVLWHRSQPKGKERFDWEKSAKFLRVPVLRKLFHELADPGKLEEWKLDEVLNWAGETLNRVDRSAFFSSNRSPGKRLKFRDFIAQFHIFESNLSQICMFGTRNRLKNSGKIQ